MDYRNAKVADGPRQLLIITHRRGHFIIPRGPQCSRGLGGVSLVDIRRLDVDPFAVLVIVAALEQELRGV